MRGQPASRCSRTPEMRILPQEKYMTAMRHPARTLLLGFCFTLCCAVSSPAQEVPLIPRAVFDSPAEHDLLTISPDGKMLAYTAPSEKGVANLWVEDLATHKKRMVSHFKERGVFEYQWT